MDGLISVLVVIGIILKFVNKSNKTGKGKNEKKKAAVHSIEAVEELAGEVIGEVVKKAKNYRADSGPAQPVTEPARPITAPTPALEKDWASHGHDEGASHADDTGCVGGSLAHESHEGLRSGGSLGKVKAEGPGGLAAAAAGPGNLAAMAKNDAISVQGPAERARISAAELRRAIITSEILREPVALRGRTARR